MDIGDVLQKGVEAASSSITAFVTAMAGVGTLSMALIQAIKDMFPVRRLYQRGWMQKHLRELAAVCAKNGLFIPSVPEESASTGSRTRSEPVDPTIAERQLIELATAGQRDAFYDLQIDQLCGQITAASQIAIDYPHRYAHLVLCLGAHADSKDFARVFQESPQYGERSQSETAIFVDARNRIAHQVQRATDAIQIACGFQWKWVMQLCAIVLSGMIALWAYLYANPARPAASSAFVFVSAGILGGFLAPVARDLVAALQSLRK
jgi:hypothetical protein